MKIGSEHLYLILGSLLFTILHFSPNSSYLLVRNRQLLSSKDGKEVDYAIIRL